MYAREQLFTETQRKRIARHDARERIYENGTIAAAVMVLAAVAAVICANSVKNPSDGVRQNHK